MGPDVGGVEGEGLLPVGPEGLGVWWRQRGRNRARSEAGLSQGASGKWPPGESWGGGAGLCVTMAAESTGTVRGPCSPGRASAMRVDPSSLCLGSKGQEHTGQVGDRSAVQRGQTGDVGERLEPHDG